MYTLTVSPQDAPDKPEIIEITFKQGDPVMRVIRLNRLRAEGFVPSSMISQLRKQRSVILSGSFEPGETRRERTMHCNANLSDQIISRDHLVNRDLGLRRGSSVVKSVVYTSVHEHFELIFNAVMGPMRVFQQADKIVPTRLLSYAQQPMSSTVHSESPLHVIAFLPFASWPR